MSKIVTIGQATLYHGDCREILPTLPKVDLVLTDPPYGIGADTHAGPEKSGWRQWGSSGWDSEKPEPGLVSACLNLGVHSIIWGGNYFTDVLPPTMQWLVWDKGQRGFSLADCEFAWSSQKRAARIFDYSRAAALQDGKEHPTQKPIALMEWCINLAPKTTSTVADPFMGSGTTGVACANMGKTFFGIERERKYFDIACERIERAYAQERLFA